MSAAVGAQWSGYPHQAEHFHRGHWRFPAAIGRGVEQREGVAADPDAQHVGAKPGGQREMGFPGAEEFQQQCHRNDEQQAGRLEGQVEGPEQGGRLCIHES